MSFTKQVILVCKYCVKPGKTGDNLRTYKYLQNLRIHAGMIHKMEVDIVDDELNWTDMKEDRYNKLAKSQELKGMNDKDRRREKKLKHNRDLIDSLSLPLDLCVDVGADADTGAPIQSTRASTSSDMDTGILDTSDWDMINDMLDSPMRVEDSPRRLEDEMHVDHSYAISQHWVENWDENWPGLDDWHNFGEYPADFSFDQLLIN